jgi:hypothetical protein
MLRQPSHMALTKELRMSHHSTPDLGSSEPTTRQRTAWVAPSVIVSHLGDARANLDVGGDGSVPTYGPYGS